VTKDYLLTNLEIDRLQKIYLQQCIRLLKPHRALSYNKVRVGAVRDGGYPIIDDFDGIKIAVSAGVGIEDTWERQIAAKGIAVKAFDPADVPDDPNRLYELNKESFVAYKEENKTMLDEILTDYKEYEAIMKIDIEGGEWEIFGHTQNDTLNKIRQFCCELHVYENYWKHSDLLLAVLEKINETFRLVHVHGNNNSDYVTLFDQNLPLVLECTFANNNYYDLVTSYEEFPTPLDAPNFKEKGEDIYLGKFTLPY